jgi:dTDP-4-amino-4,6-dideoxygalactose transaminase
MPVPLLDVIAQNQPLHADFTAAFHRVLGHGMFIMGKEVETLEAHLREFLGVKHAFGVSSGTDALVLGLMALGIQEGDEVLCPAFTFFATAGSVSRLGATPIFVDVLPDTFNIDLEDAAGKITDKTKAIIPVHLFGQSADMDGVLALAEKHQLLVLEDAAQSLGARYKDQQTGSIGHLGAYSFFPSKNLGALGDAGLLVTNDDALAQRAKILRVHGMEPKYYHHEIGGNFRIDALQAALLDVKLSHYADYTQARVANAAYYQTALAPHVAGKIVLPIAQSHNTHIWNQFTLRVLHGQRDALKQHLISNGIGCEIYYPVTLDQQQCFAALPAHTKIGCEVSHQLALEALSIPIYPELTIAQKDEVIAALLSFLQA